MQQVMTRAPAPLELSRAGDRNGIAVAFALLGTFALGVAVRVYVLSTTLGRLNSDEAVGGLMAERVLRGDLSLIVAGNNYGGTLDIFLAAPLLAVFGASGLVLKAVPMLCWLLVSVVLYLVASASTDRRTAALLAAAHWVFSAGMVQMSTTSYPGYSSGVVVCLLVLLLLGRELPGGALVVDSRRVLGRRLLLGFLTGFALWLHPMYLAFLVPAHVFVAVRRIRVPLWMAPTAAGALLGFAPMLVYNLRNDFASLRLFPQPPSTYAGRLTGFFTELLPRVSGLEALDGTWTGGGIGQALYLALLLLLAWSVLRLLRGGTAQEQLVAWLALSVPLLTAGFSTSWFYGDGRYGVYYSPLLVLVLGLALRRRAPDLRVPPAALFAVPFLAFALLCFPALRPATGPAHVGGADTDIEQVLVTLKEAGVDRVRADYWIAYRLGFLSDGDVVATPYEWVRFTDDDQTVLAAGDAAAIVLYANNPRDAELRAAPGTRVRREIAQYAVYLPQATSDG